MCICDTLLSDKRITGIWLFATHINTSKDYLWARKDSSLNFLVCLDISTVIMQLF